MDPKNNQLKTLDEMVFEDRNKEYGAYFLRKNYSSYLTRAALIGIGFALTIFLGSWGYYKYILPALDKANEEAIEIDLSKLKQEEVPEEKPDIPPPPPEAPPPPPPEVKQIKFLPPVPKRDEEVVIEEPPPPIEETEKAVISNKTVEGEDAVSDFTPPPPPPAITKPVELEKPAEEEIFTAVEQSPEFPGGVKEMYKYLGDNIKYPSAAQRANVSGKVFVKFVVERDGSIGNVDVMKGIGFGCDEEAIRVIKSMPKWNPGKQNGKSVRVFYTMPVVYTLE